MLKFITNIVFSFFILNTTLHADLKLIEKEFWETIKNIQFTLNDTRLSKEGRLIKIAEIIEPQFDFELMAKISLGKYWNTLSKDDKNKFTKLYVERMKRSYSSKLDLYKGEKTVILNISQPKANRVVLETKLVTIKEDFPITYKYYKPKKRIDGKKDWIVYDVDVLGVSILKTDRSQFNAYLKTHSVEELMKYIQDN